MMNQFQFSCGATGPLRLIGGGREWTLPQPFAVIGRDGAADVVLDHRQVSRRHAYLQVIRGHMFCMDLGSRTGIQWEDGRPSASGWVDPDRGIRVGPFEVRPLPDGGPGPAGRRGDSDPLETPLPGPEPSLEIGPAPGAESPRGKLPVRRPLRCAITVVGSGSGCGIRLPDRSVARYQCALVRTPTGTWVVDLLGRNGLAVNGMRTRCARLMEGDELRIGGFVASLRDDPASAGRATGSTALATARPPQWSYPLAPIHGSTGQVPALPFPGPGGGRLDGPALADLLNQVGAMQGQMLRGYNQSVMMAAQLFATLCWEQMGAFRDEMDRAQEIVRELRALKEGLESRLAEPSPSPSPSPSTALPGPSARGANGSRANGEAKAPPRPRVADRPGAPAEGGGTDPDGDPQSYQEMCLWLCQRAELMDGEQQVRWRKVLGSILGARRGK